MASHAVGKATRSEAVVRSNVVPLVTIACICLAALCDLPTRITFGSVSGSAILTTFVASLCVVTFPAILPTPMWRWRPVLPLWGFVAWSLFVSATKGVGVPGAQNLLVYLVFASAVTYTTVWCDDEGADTVARWLQRCGWLVAAAYGASVALDGVGAESILGRRSFGLVALIFMALTVPQGSEGGRLARAAPWVLFLLVGLSLSRTATVAAAVLLAARAAHGRNGRKIHRAVALSLLVSVAMLLVAFYVPTVTDRMFGGDRGYTVGGVTLNTEGRTRIWGAVGGDIATSPLIGHGAGSAGTRVAQYVPGQDEPHNDYLRVIYDYGYIGIAIFAWAYLSLIRATWNRARFHRESIMSAAPHTAAVLALLSVAIGMTTDNVLIYAFVMAPLGVMVGLSLRQPFSGTSRPPRTRHESPALNGDGHCLGQEGSTRRRRQVASPNVPDTQHVKHGQPR